MTTTFTADVVDFSLVPEKFAAAQTMIVAEFNVEVESNWQASIDNWFQASAAVGTAAYPTSGAPIANSVLTPAFASALIEASTTIFTQSQDQGVLEPPKKLIGISTAVGSTQSGGISQSTAKDGLKQLVYQICNDAGWFDGTATGPTDTVKSSLTSIFNSMLSNIAGAGADVDRALSIDIDKIDNDMKETGSGVGVSGQEDDDEVQDLRQLVNAYAFVPVMNRFIRGGNFRNISNGLNATNRRFDSGKSTPVGGVVPVAFIPKDAKLVFPVRIKFADDAQLLEETSTTTEQQGFRFSTTSGTTDQTVDFQLNIIFADADDAP